MKVWSTDRFTDIAFQNQLALQGYTSEHYLPESNFRVAIVGGGPKGAYAIERLASFWNASCPGKFLDIVCFNKTADFGSGPNYQNSQPDFLLMNYNLGKVDFWTDEQEQLVYDRPDLEEFLNRFNKEPDKEILPSDYCTRALTGIYYQYCLYKVIEAGMIRFDLTTNPKVSFQLPSDDFKISNHQDSFAKVADLLIDARIPKSGGLATQPEYIRRLVIDLGVDFFTNEDYKTGCLEIDTAGRLKKHKQICLYGKPTEGWTLDNESLSRSNNNFLSPWAKKK